MSSVEVQSLHIYPVKSCGGIDLNEATIGSRGFLFDRNWMIITPDGGMITQRQHPELALIQTEITADTLRLSMKGQETLVIPLHRETGTPIDVTIFGEPCKAIDEGWDAADWLSSALKTE